MSGAVIGVDLGGTKIAAALVSATGDVGTLLAVPTPRTGRAALLAAVIELCRDVARAQPIRGIGIGTAGVVDAATGTITGATEILPEWPGTPLAQAVSQAWDGIPVTVRNDVDAHALGESWVGAAQGASSALMVAVGTGVGAGLVCQGHLWFGARGVAGEVGHLPIGGADHLRCPCGRFGHLEALASGPGLHRHYLTLPQARDLADARAVVDAAVAGEVPARQAVSDSATALGRAIAGMATFLDPEVIVLGGGLADAGAIWWQPMEAALRAELIDSLADIPLRRSALGGAAPIVGAAYSVFQQLGS